MNIFKRIGAVLTGAKPEHALARDYPQNNLLSAPAFANYPQKAYLGDQGIFAYRMEFMVTEADARRILNTLNTEFDLMSQDMFQEGHLATPTQSIHFSLRPEFGGVRVAIVTNSVKLLEGIDALALEPPPPWAIFPEADPSALGSLQGPMAYWWDWFFLPFWTTANASKRQRYLAAHPTDQEWVDFLMLHSPS
ncbi:hypothetical protein FHW58_001883 [Duganella sp. 1224]|uniref:hypothetical protein n=1 Tax=Duganella sp. 1224 TaxID=2587052 RepID=UPI0015CA319D|nr:hypothetical protein [Duganella sp. 1224]NYE60731.1 hypothetical protein [Duganella sp. 1224]